MIINLSDVRKSGQSHQWLRDTETGKEVLAIDQWPLGILIRRSDGKQFKIAMLRPDPLPRIQLSGMAYNYLRDFHDEPQSQRNDPIWG